MITGPLPSWLECQKGSVSRYTRSSGDGIGEAKALGNSRSKGMTTWTEVDIDVDRDGPSSAMAGHLGCPFARKRSLSCRDSLHVRRAAKE